MINKIGIIANPSKKKALLYQKRIAAYLKKKNKSVITDKEVPRADIAGKVDLIIALGGDGTLLNIAKYIKNSTLVLGVNLGGFGFLTEVKANEIYEAIDDILKGNFKISIRRMISAKLIRKKSSIEKLIALNDMVISKGSLSRILKLSLSIDDELVATYLCDGLIVASSTGSTAHSLSAGGPIITPEVDALVLTPICPHTLSNRPLVLASNKEIKIKIAGREAKNIALTSDGQVALKLKIGDVISINRAANNLKLVTSNKRGYFRILREKLKWGRLR